MADSEIQLELAAYNQRLQARAAKFGTAFTPLTVPQFREQKLSEAIANRDESQLARMVIKEDLQQAALRRDKFGVTVRLEQDQHFESRRKPNYGEGISIREDALHLFGVDLMSSDMIRDYFRDFYIRIEWIDDSSCNVRFKSTQEAKRALQQFRVGSVEQSDEDECNLFNMWLEIQGFEAEGSKRRLFCRFATSEDKKLETQSGHNSKFYQMQKQKQSLMRNLINMGIGQLREMRQSRLGEERKQRRVRERSREKQDKEASRSKSEEKSRGKSEGQSGPQE